MKLSRLALPAALLALLSAGSAFAASAWTPFGPSGGSIRSLAIAPGSPGELYAGTYGGGIFKSTDGGATWSSLSPAIRRQTVNAVAIDPSRPQTILVGTYNDGVWKSSDGGSTWKRVLHGGSDVGNQQAPVSAIVFDPSNPRIVYAATDTGPNDGVHKSADGGATWVRNTGGLPNNFRIDALGIDPKNPATLYAGLNGGGLCKSTDGGRSWTSIPRPGDNEFVLSLAIDPSEPETIFAGTINIGRTASPPTAERPSAGPRLETMKDARSPRSRSTPPTRRPLGRGLERPSAQHRRRKDLGRHDARPRTT